MPDHPEQADAIGHQRQILAAIHAPESMRRVLIAMELSTQVPVLAAPGTEYALHALQAVLPAALPAP